jgi:hypothetical protein
MNRILRQTPATFPTKALRSEVRGNWTVILEYENEAASELHLFDLSHFGRWDVQDADISRFEPQGVEIPKTPGQSRFHKGLMINRMNRTQASIWNLNKETPPLPEDAAYTDTTDATVHLGILGKGVYSLAEKLTALDFIDMQKKPPFLLQGPFSHVPAQIVSLNFGNKMGGLLLTCSRGYTTDMVHSILSEGKEFNIAPAGEDRFLNHLGAATTT